MNGGTRSEHKGYTIRVVPGPFLGYVAHISKKGHPYLKTVNHILPSGATQLARDWINQQENKK